MKRTFQWLALTICLAGPARADDLCGRLPVFDYARTESSGNVALDFLKGLVGKAGAQGSFTSAPEDVIHLYPNPDKLLPRITVFVVECKLVMEDTTLNSGQKRAEIIKIYNQVFLQKDGAAPDRSGTRVAALVPVIPLSVNDAGTVQVASSARQPTIQDEIRAKEAWRENWFHESLDGPTPANVPGRYHVIVASPCGDDAAQKAITSYSRRYPDIYFELWRTVGKCYFAVTVGTGLEQNQAEQLLALVKQRGMSGYLWHW